MLLGVIQLLRAHRMEERNWYHVNANLCIQIVLINPFVPNAPFLYPMKGRIGNKWVKYLVHKLLGIVTEFVVSFIKVPALLRISVLKNLFSVFIQHYKKLSKKFLWRFFFNDRNLPVVFQFSHEYFEWKFCILTSMYVLF